MSGADSTIISSPYLSSFIFSCTQGLASSVCVFFCEHTYTHTHSLSLARCRAYILTHHHHGPSLERLASGLRLGHAFLWSFICPGSQMFNGIVCLVCLMCVCVCRAFHSCHEFTNTCSVEDAMGEGVGVHVHSIWRTSLDRCL